MNELRINGPRLWTSLMDLARIGATDKGGVKRLALTDLDRQGRDLVVQWAKEAGLGITVQPSFMIHELLRGRKLVRVLPGWEMQALTVFAVYPSRQFLPPKVRSFIDFMVEYFGDEPYWDRDLP